MLVAKESLRIDKSESQVGCCQHVNFGFHTRIAGKFMEHLAKSMPSCMLVPLDGPSDSRPHRDNTIRSRLRGCSLSQLPWLKRPSVNLKPPASVKTADLIHVWGNLFSGQPSRVCYPGVDCWPAFTLKTKSTCRESIGVGAKSSPENKHSLIDLPSIGATDYQIQYAQGGYNAATPKNPKKYEKFSFATHPFWPPLLIALGSQTPEMLWLVQELGV